MDDLINSLCVQQRLVLKDVQSKPAWTSNAWRGGEAIKLNYFSPSQQHLLLVCMQTLKQPYKRQCLHIRNAGVETESTRRTSRGQCLHLHFPPHLLRQGSAAGLDVGVGEVVLSSSVEHLNGQTAQRNQIISSLCITTSHNSQPPFWGRGALECYLSHWQSGFLRCSVVKRERICHDGIVSSCFKPSRSHERRAKYNLVHQPRGHYNVDTILQKSSPQVFNKVKNCNKKTHDALGCTSTTV